MSKMIRNIYSKYQIEKSGVELNSTDYYPNIIGIRRECKRKGVHNDIFCIIMKIGDINVYREYIGTTKATDDGLLIDDTSKYKTIMLPGRYKNYLKLSSGMDTYLSQSYPILIGIMKKGKGSYETVDCKTSYGVNLMHLKYRTVAKSVSDAICQYLKTEYAIMEIVNYAKNSVFHNDRRLFDYTIIEDINGELKFNNIIYGEQNA